MNVYTVTNTSYKLSPLNAINHCNTDIFTHVKGNMHPHICWLLVSSVILTGSDKNTRLHFPNVQKHLFVLDTVNLTSTESRVCCFRSLYENSIFLRKFEGLSLSARRCVYVLFSDVFTWFVWVYPPMSLWGHLQTQYSELSKLMFWGYNEYKTYFGISYGHPAHMQVITDLRLWYQCFWCALNSIKTSGISWN